MLIGSLLYGQKGKYNLGFEIEFRESDKSPFSNKNFILCSLNSVLCFQPFRIATLSYLHILVHEMGHAITARRLNGGHISIEVFTDKFGGRTCHGFIGSDLKSSAIALGGPLASMVFSSIQLAASVLMVKYVFRPVGYFIGVGAVIWMIGELLYATLSGVFKEGGDFRDIALKGLHHLLISSALLVSTCAVGVIGTKKLMNHLNVKLPTFLDIRKSLSFTPLISGRPLTLYP